MPPRSCSYLIGVLGADAATSFTVICASSASAVTLQYGVPLAAQHVALDEYRYYEFLRDSYDEGIVISVTMSTGDADIFVAFNTDRPSKDQHQFQVIGRSDCNSVDCGNSIASGDAIHITQGQLSLCPEVRGRSRTQFAGAVSF